MNKNVFSPYIRTAMFSTIKAPFTINQRIIFDYEIILVCDGKCKLTIHDTEYICKKNDVIFLRPDIPHKFESIQNFDFVQPHIHFDILYSDKSEETPVSFKDKDNMSDYELSLIQNDEFINLNIPYIFTPYAMEDFKKVFFEIITLFQEKPYNYILMYKSKILELLNYILIQFEDDNEYKTPDNFSVLAVKNYIDNNYLSVITLDSLSKQFCLNKFTLLRKFKSLYNENIISYYRNKRIDYSKRVLRETSLSISAISHQLNFSDIYSFSRFFKAYVGCSPTIYRKTYK